VRLGLQQAIHWPAAATESKAVLKRILARQLPREWIYRAKSGFTPPIARDLRAAGPQRALHEVVLAAGNPLRPYLKMRAVGRMVSRTVGGRPLPHATYNFIWTLLATSLWLDQLGRRPMSARR
jgi:asparagine synthetase B (glutamine-hydrolysing)